jgi:hypothetical protein
VWRGWATAPESSNWRRGRRMRHNERRCEGLVQLHPSIIVVAGLDPATSHGGVMLQGQGRRNSSGAPNANRFKLENDDEH